MIRHRTTTGRFELVARGVFRLAGAPGSWHQNLMIAVLAWGDDVAVSHRAAAALHRLPGVAPGIVELTVPKERRRQAPGQVHRNRLEPDEIARTGTLPVTTPARTLIDLARVVAPEALEEALDDALRRGLVTRRGLRARIDALAARGRPGTTAIRRALDARAGPAVPQSVLETRLLRTLAQARLPRPAIQHRVYDARGRLVAIPDFAYPDRRLAIEGDGRRWHSSRARWHTDRARANALTLLGWRILYVTWRDLTEHPEAVVAAVRAGLDEPGATP